MKNTLILLVAGTMAFSGCQSKTEKVTEPDTAAAYHKTAKPTVLNLESPVVLDSSEYVMYPLPNERGNDNDEGGSFSKDGGRETTYWNIIFYNTATKKYHLLDDKHKMIINTYNTSYSNEYSDYGSPSSVPDKLNLQTSHEGNYIFYSVVIKDYNKDGKLDNRDPDYLFMSDKEGNNFKQISPDGMSVNSWEFIKKSDQVLMLTVHGGSYDSQTDSVRTAVPYIYDLKKGGAPSQVFSTEFSGMIDKLHRKLWSAKKKE